MSALGILVLMMTVDYVPGIRNGLSQNSFQSERFCIFIFIAVAMELVNAGVLLRDAMRMRDVM